MTRRKRDGGRAPSLTLVALAFVALGHLHVEAATVSGTVSRAPEATVISAARVTLFTPNLQFFREVRSDTNGAFQFENVPAGTYQIGASAPGRGYSEFPLTVSGIAVTRSFALGVETEGGRWEFIGDTAPELIDGTGSGTILPTGEMFMCHDTLDPVAFEPITRFKWLPPGSGSAQGCHIPTLLTDGRLLLAGGSDGGNPQDPVVRTVKVYDRVTNSWAQLRPMNIGRWYPGIVRLPDERLMVLGGELDDSGFGRTDSCEIYDPVNNTWTLTSPFDLPTEIPPTVVLRTGEVLKTWRYPEIYNIASGQWRPAPTMVQPREGAAQGGHCDHEIVHLPDGRVMAVGVDAITTDANTRFSEFYDPVANNWSLGPSPQHLRTQPEALLLPDGKVLAYGGIYSGLNPGSLTLQNAGQVPNCTNVADLFDPATNQWRAVAPLNRYIHYHNVSMLLADGRVMNTGGAGGGSLFGDDNRIEAYEPPYMFRGVRPRIDSVSTTDLVLGGSFNMDVSFTSAVTKVVLLGTRAATHWVDGGTQCYASLAFTQTGSTLDIAIPNDPVTILPGVYFIFALVDDIPSVGRIVRVTAGPTPTPTPGCLNYTFNVSAGDIVPGAIDTGNHTDNGSTVIALPFSYQLYDQMFTNVAVGSNGHLTFGTVNDAPNPGCIPIATATYAIGPYWTDQCTNTCSGNTGTGYGIFTSISGVAPNRIFNIEWRTAYFESGASAPTLHYEVRLYEGQTAFDVIYGKMPPTFTPPAARNLSVGVQRTDATQFTLLGCDATGGGSPPVSTAQIYRYTLTGCGTPTPSPTPTPGGTPSPTATPGGTSTPTPSPTPTATPVVTPTPTVTPTPMPTRLANISTRLRVETNDNVLIGGFIIAGSAQKRLILRAMGPSLPLGDRLANPTLELYNGAGQLIAANDNWQDADNRQEIIDTNIPPTNDLESAILRNFDPGAYTAIVRGVANGTGVGLVEVYDLGNVQDSKLANLSSRGLVRTGDNVMIGGLIVTGSSPQRVILRAIGPSLPVNGKLLDPFLQLYDGNGTLLQSNDSWRSDQEAEIIATMLPPSDNAEAAIVRNLPPAAYTAIVSGVGGTTGVALVEVYALQ
jgi:hypothetical protein